LTSTAVGFTAVPPPVTAGREIAVPPRRRLTQFLANGKATTGLVLLLIFTAVAALGSSIAPYDPSGRSRDILQSPSFKHWFGTTHIGQDIFSQVLVGTRSVMFVGFTAGLVATLVAVAIGVTSGYVSGAAAESLSAASNVFIVIPALPLIIIISNVVPNSGDWTIALVIGCTSWAWGARLLRAQTLSLRGRDFVEAARATGESSWRIIGFEILPNLTAIIAASFIGTVMFAVATEISLAFVGISGISEWNWGEILFWAQGQQAMPQGAWWWFVPVGLCIALLGTALSLVNFGIDEFVNPRLRDSGRGTVKTADGRRVRMRVGFTPVTGHHNGDHNGPGNGRREPEIGSAPTTSGTPSTEPVLEIRGLCVDYGIGDQAVQAVRDVSLILNRGEVLGLAGESGGGKSTLAYGLTRLLPPPGVISAGEVIYRPRDGEPVDVLTLSSAQLREFRWAQTSIVFQGAMNALNPVHPVSTQLMDVVAAHEPGLGRQARRSRARELLRMVGISDDRLQAYPHQLSGGMRQRVMIGMALALQPKIVIMDEPTTALDVVMQRQILRQLTELRAQFDFSVLFITHDLSLLVEFSDRIAIMYGGRIVEEAPASALYRDALHPYSDGLLHSFPALRGPRRDLAGIPGSPPDLRAMPTGCSFHPRCPKAFDRCPVDVPVLDIPADRAAADRAVACWLHPVRS
jgi:peptide/nickel transport system permease protein